MRHFSAIILAGAALLLPSVLRGQTTNYSMSWHAMGGGGGASSGGNYAVTGTIGQSATATMSGGSYVLTGGFWSIISAVQTPGAPPLRVGLLGGQAIISWPVSTASFVLQQSPNLAAGVWSLSSVTLTTNNGVIFATVPATAGYQFFRLQSQ